MTIVPISLSTVDWASLLQATQTALGRNVLAAVDNERRAYSDLAKTIAAYGAFAEPRAKPTTLISESTSVLRHLHFAFLVLAEEEALNEVRDRTALAFTTARDCKRGKSFAVVSGTLDQWKVALIESCSPNSTEEVRTLFSGFLVWFDRQGLSEVFQQFSRRSHADGTILLEHKK